MASENDAESSEVPETVPTTTKVKAFVEMCGRHPFATGLFALIGLAGLAFSVFQFAVDQRQNAEDGKIATATLNKVSTTQKSLASVDEKLDSLADTTTDSDEAVAPVSAEIAPIDHALDNVTFPESVSGRYDGSTPLSKIYREQSNGFGHFSFFGFTMRSTLNQDFARVAPFVVAQVIDVRPISDKIFTHYRGERGDAAILYYFHLALLPERGIQVAPLVSPDTGIPRSDVQYFKLAPRESEEAMLDISYVPGYIYHLRLGLQYRTPKGDKLVWITPVFRSGLPSKSHPVKNFDADAEVKFHPDLEMADAGETRRRARSYKSFIQRQPLFRPLF
jgi:hypothetical protein